MKIYFEDGELNSRDILSFRCDHIIDAKAGYSDNVYVLDLIQTCFPWHTVYTNSLVALSNEYTWNEELQVHELYIRPQIGKHTEFTRIDELTTRELKPGHNLMKMYMANEFGNL